MSAEHVPGVAGVSSAEDREDITDSANGAVAKINCAISEDRGEVFIVVFPVANGVRAGVHLWLRTAGGSASGATGRGASSRSSGAAGSCACGASGGAAAIWTNWFAVAVLAAVIEAIEHVFQLQAFGAVQVFPIHRRSVFLEKGGCFFDDEANVGAVVPGIAAVLQVQHGAEQLRSQHIARIGSIGGIQHSESFLHGTDGAVPEIDGAISENGGEVFWMVLPITNGIRAGVE